MLFSLSLLARGPVVLAQNEAVSGSAGAGQAALGAAKTQATAGEKPKPAEKAAKGSAKTSGSSKPKAAYVKEEPMNDPAGSSTRVHRPGQDALPPTAPPISQGGSAESPMPLLSPPPPSPAKEKFPSVGQLEKLMFGHSTPTINVENRLDKLEAAIFQKSYPEHDVEGRIHRLKEVIVGEESPAAPAAATAYGLGAYPAGGSGGAPYSGPHTSFPPLPPLPSASGSAEEPAPKAPFFPNYGHFDLNQQLSITEAEKFGMDVVNEVRAQQGLNELNWDELAYKVASEQVNDLVKRQAVSHQNSKGENPDLRYSVAGGSDAMVESSIMFPLAENLKPTRQLVVKILEALSERQDDREAMLYSHATNFAMSFQWTPDHRKLICCMELVTKHGQMESVPLQASVGDKIEVKGSIASPYRFNKMTLAWEGQSTAPPDDGAEASEALPYFPPLDYEAHATKSNRDFDKGVKFLQIAGITAAIAGGLFIPPVALAAPLIAATVATPSPKPVSEIPVRGGVKTDGSNFAHKVTLSNQGKEGIYYLTVWASTGAGDEIVPVSRRAIIAHGGKGGSSAQPAAEKEKDKEEPVSVKEEPKGEEKKDGNGQQGQPPASGL